MEQKEDDEQLKLKIFGLGVFVKHLLAMGGRYFSRTEHKNVITLGEALLSMSPPGDF